MKEAIKEEIHFIKGISLYEEAIIEECWERIGHAPVSTKWVDVNKGREGEVEVVGLPEISAISLKTGRGSSPACLRWRQRSASSV